MGDVADMILDGILCEQCGCIMEDLLPKDDSKELLQAPMHPRKCKDCENDK